ncbi:hypothetical protein [Actinomadura sp. WMMA1423]|uniref:hypothetical protein n=1 Tax=Actinomadura sp. WMMA1423 TaxID=2591108 RepID=UPI00143D4D20|nr:hypothetical protein [Actinomadura sp. WMMA1423]
MDEYLRLPVDLLTELPFTGDLQPVALRVFHARVREPEVTAIARAELVEVDPR